MEQIQYSATILKYAIYPGNHGEEIRNVLRESNNTEEIPYQQEEQCLKECNLIWKPLDLSFKALFAWDQITKQLTSSTIRLLNHIENMRNITTKTGIIRSLKKYYQGVEMFNPNAEITQVFDVVPTTFIVNTQFKTTDMHRFIKRFSDLAQNEGLSLKESIPAKHCTKNIWLLKPAALNQGRGIQIFQRIKEIFDHIDSNAHQNNYWVIQKYIERPLLFKNRKFDIRMWVLVTMGQNGTDINLYMYREGYLRTSSSVYDLQDENKYVHLTNNCLQQKGNQYGQHEEGNTVSFQVFQNYLDKQFKGQDIQVERDFIPRMRDIIIDSILSIKEDLNPSKRKNAFELLGYDFLIDEDFRIWLLEVNNNPYLGVPNNFIRGLLPQMIRDMFKVVIPLSTALNFKDVNPNNGFDIVYSDSQEINMRRSLSLDLLYPIQDYKQPCGKDKKAQILKQRKERFKLQQTIYQQQSNEKFMKMSLQANYDDTAKLTFNYSTFFNKKQLQINSFKETIIQSGQGTSRTHLRSSTKDDFKEIQKIAVQNQLLLNKLNGKIPQSPILMDHENTLDLLRTQQLKKKDNFKKDVLQETREICLKRETQVTPQQFDYLLNKIASKISQWELFNDKQVQKALDSFEILCNSKAVVHFHNSNSIDKLVKIIENDEIPFRHRIYLMEQLEMIAKMLVSNILFIDNKNLINMLKQYVIQWVDCSNNESDSEGQQVNKFGELSFKIMLLMLQLNSNASRSYIPKVTKEREQLRNKAIENGILITYVSLFLKGKFENEIKQNILFKLTVKDLQTQLQFLQTSDSQSSLFTTEIEYLQNMHQKLKSDLQTLVQKEQQQKHRQQEDERLLKLKNEEEKEQRRKVAEQMLQKRLEEKRRLQTEERKKQKQEQQLQEKEIQEKRQIKVQRYRIKSEQKSQKKIQEIKDYNLTNNDYLDQDTRKTNIQQSESERNSQVRMAKKRKLKISQALKKDIVDIGNLMDNLIIFTHQKIKKQIKETDQLITKDTRNHSNIRGSYQQVIDDYELKEVAKTSIRNNNSKKDSYNILKNLKQIKDKHENTTDISELFKNSEIFGNLGKKTLYNKFKEKKPNSFALAFNLSDQKQNRNLMILPSLDYDILQNKKDFLKAAGINHFKRQSSPLQNSSSKQIDASKTVVKWTDQNPKVNMYFKHRANSRPSNQQPNKTDEIFQKAHLAKTTLKRKLSPLQTREASSSNVQSPRQRINIYSDKTSKEISDIIQLMLNSRKPKE